MKITKKAFHQGVPKMTYIETSKLKKFGIESEGGGDERECISTRQFISELIKRRWEIRTDIPLKKSTLTWMTNDMDDRLHHDIETIILAIIQGR